MTTPKYRTDAKACSCPGYWYRRTCNHYRAYGEAMALVVEQDKANAAFSSQGAPIASWEPTESGRKCPLSSKGTPAENVGAWAVPRLFRFRCKEFFVNEQLRGFQKQFIRGCAGPWD